MKKVLAIVLSLCLLAGLCSCSMFSRYASEEEMKEALIGVWTTEDQTAQFTIGETSLNYRKRFLDGSSTDLNFDHTILEWNYRKGELTADQTHPITVSEDGSYILWQEMTFYSGGQLAIPKGLLLEEAMKSTFTLGGGLYTITFGDIVEDTDAVQSYTVDYFYYEDADAKIKEAFSNVLDQLKGDKYVLTFTGSVNSNPQAADVLPNYQDPTIFAYFLISVPESGLPVVAYSHTAAFDDMAILWNAYCNTSNFYY